MNNNRHHMSQWDPRQVNLLWLEWLRDNTSHIEAKHQMELEQKKKAERISEMEQTEENEQKKALDPKNDMERKKTIMNKKRKPKTQKHSEKKPLNKRHHSEEYPRYPSKHVRSLSIRSAPEDPCFSCLRTAVHCYNIVILVLGLGVLGIGIWLLVTEYSAREVSVLIGSQMFEIATYLMIAGGGTITLLAFCGCCGTMREDRCVLAFYGVTLSLVLFALVGGGALAFIFRQTLSTSVKDSIEDTLQKSYGVDLRKNSSNRLITDAWDSMQRQLECCGVSGGVNSTKSWAFYKLHSTWYTQTNQRTPYVPDSCCSGNKGICQGTEEIHGPPTKGPPMTNKYVMNKYLYTDGCYDKVMVHLQRNSLILGGVASCVPLLLIVGIVVVFCLCARVRKEDLDDLDDV